WSTRCLRSAASTRRASLQPAAGTGHAVPIRTVQVRAVAFVLCLNVLFSVHFRSSFLILPMVSPFSPDPIGPSRYELRPHHSVTVVTIVLLRATPLVLLPPSFSLGRKSSLRNEPHLS